MTGPQFIAINILIHISINKKITSRELAISTSSSVSYIEQILSVLKRDGYIKSSRGPRGGYTLNKDAKKIAIIQVLNSFNNKTLNKIEQEIYRSVYHNIKKLTLYDISQKIPSVCLEEILIN
ncbi:Rrf2 family transcriptional regulator [Photobacterium damselae subsp. damselae]|uniref:Rrf2 family transcriptional regulator n=1 Tax=Photobacterium damselae TaxID=38293 RepID=UPI00083B04EB|nr:Rrf2 family transcriptional regulator [Photobacterium damselae]QSH59311.1 Rrf2 family transcriptional regulator [Photobacterium damselae subsp. damselae]